MSVTKIKKKTTKKSSATKGSRRKPFSMSKMIFTQKEGFSSGFTTPPEVYAALNKYFHFTTRDPSLSKAWGKRVFVNGYVNPETWISMALNQIRRKNSALVVMLLKGDISTAAFHEGIIPYASELYAVRGRLRFGRQKGNAPIGSVIAVFKAGPKIKIWSAKKERAEAVDALREQGKKERAEKRKVATKSKTKKTPIWKKKTWKLKGTKLRSKPTVKISPDPIPEEKTEEKTNEPEGEKILP